MQQQDHAAHAGSGGLPPQSEASVVVIGAGIAGLSAALTLAEAGLSPLVLEADSDYCGGRFGGQPSVEFEFQGRHWSFPGEHGIHGFWSQYHNLRALMARFGIEPPLVWSQRQDWVYADGRRVWKAEIGRKLRTSLLPAPFHFLSLLTDLNFLRMLGPLDLLRIPWVGMGMLTMLAIDPAREGEAVAEMSVRDFLFGWPNMLRAFAGALSRSGLSTGSGEVPISGFIALFRFYSLLRRDSVGFQHLRGDPDRHIISPMLEALTKRGGHIAQGITATQLTRRDGDTWTVRWRAAGGEATGEIDTRHVVLAVDASSAKQILSDSPYGTFRPQLAARTGALTFPEGRATSIVRLWFKTCPRVVAEGGMFGGDFVLDNFFWLHLFQDDFMEWRRQTGGSTAECHVYGPPELLAQPDETLLAVAGRDVVKAYPELRGQLVHGVIQRDPATHTLFHVGQADRYLGVITPWDGLYCCGDWVRYETPSLFLERSCVTGLAAANEVLRKRGLETVPLLPYTPPELTAAVLEAALRAVRGFFEAAARLMLSRK